jgi:hypothetical protein
MGTWNCEVLEESTPTFNAQYAPWNNNTTGLDSVQMWSSVRQTLIYKSFSSRLLTLKHFRLLVMYGPVEKWACWAGSESASHSANSGRLSNIQNLFRTLLWKAALAFNLSNLSWPATQNRKTSHHLFWMDGQQRIDSTPWQDYRICGHDCFYIPEFLSVCSFSSTFLHDWLIGDCCR